MSSTDRAELSKKISAQARLLLRPLDLKGLVTRGIIVQEGDWYRILKFKALPEHALAQVSVLTQDSCGTTVKFLKVSKRSSTQLKKIVGADRKPNS